MTYREIKAEIRATVTPTLLETIGRLVELVGNSVDMVETDRFYRELCYTAELPIRELTAVEEEGDGGERK